MTKPILEIAKELLELEKKATPGEWIPCTEEECASCRTTGSKKEDREFIAFSRNHIKTLCEALVEAQGMISHAVAIGYVGEGSTKGWFEEWLKKWGGDE